MTESYKIYHGELCKKKELYEMNKAILNAKIVYQKALVKLGNL